MPKIIESKKELDKNIEFTEKMADAFKDRTLSKIYFYKHFIAPDKHKKLYLIIILSIIGVLIGIVGLNFQTNQAILFISLFIIVICVFSFLIHAYVLKEVYFRYHKFKSSWKKANKHYKKVKKEEEMMEKIAEEDWKKAKEDLEK